MVCMHQCKIFTGYSCDGVENDVNKWFRENPHIAVFDVTYSKHQGGEHTIFVLYDPMDGDE